MDNLETIGHHPYRYEVIPDWGLQESRYYPVNDCHEMVIDRNGHLFMLTNDTHNNLIIYDKSGKLIGTWGTSYPGAHGLTITEENENEFLFITDYERHQVIKTTLDGREVMILDYPKEIEAYHDASHKYKPTETAIAPNGDIYVTDGYGLQYIIQYNHVGKYIRHWGGKGDKDAQFDCAHGIAIDGRDPAHISLLITSRNHNVIKRFTLSGIFINTIYLPGSFVCRPVVHKQNIYAAVFRSGNNQNNASGYITILDSADRVISSPGATPPVYIHGELQPQKKQGDFFIHPHDVCIDDEDNLYIPQWNAKRTYPIKLLRIFNN